MANISNPSTGATRQGKSGPRLKDRNGAALGAYGPGAAFVLCLDANKFGRLAMGVSPVFAHWRGLLWIAFFNQCSIDNLRARKIGLIKSAFAVY